MDAPRAAAIALLITALACDGADQAECEGALCGSARIEDELPYAREVIKFSPGPHAGFGADRLPSIVLGPPFAERDGGGSLDVLSLGVGGEIVLGFGDRAIRDGEGADLVVFENPFLVGGNPREPFAELGEVSVSTDAVSWRTFACNAEGDGSGRWPGCAGWSLTRFFDPLELRPLDPEKSGGDAFDLAEVGLDSARFVRVRDLSTEGEGRSAGFDLDAVGAIHLD